MRRAERLVAAGVIDKVSLGRTDSFRSVAYTYFTEEDDDDDEDVSNDVGAVGGAVAGVGARGGNNGTNTTTSLSVVTDQPSASSNTEGMGVRAVGEDLYHHLRVVLGRYQCHTSHHHPVSHTTPSSRA